MVVSALPLSGEGWTLFRGPLRAEGSTEPPDVGRLRRIGAVRVPGNIQTQLGLPDPILDVPGVTTLNDFEWLHATSFDTPREGDQPRARAFLVFDGVDYFCDVWVNGNHAGHHQGMFTGFELDVTAALRPLGEPNELLVAVSCPWRIDARTYRLQPSTAAGPAIKDSEYMKGNVLHYWDALPLAGNAVLPFGLFRDLRLEVRRGPALLRASVATVALDEHQAELELLCEWWSAEAAAVESHLQWRVEPETFEGNPVEFSAQLVVAPGRTETRTRFTLADPRPWWTWDTGRPDLYRFVVEPPAADPSSGQGAAVGTFGVRVVEREDATLTYTLNGRRLFLRGAWYPFAGLFPADVADAAYQRDVAMLRDANCNHVAVVGYIERPVFYEACDRAGMLVFQQLPFTQFGPMGALDAAYPRRDAYSTWALGEVDNVVRQLRGHPSVAVWAAFAETRKDGRWVWGDYEPFAEAIGDVVRTADPDALYHASFCDLGEGHIWSGGYPFGEFSDHYQTDHRFVSEFGAIAPPVVETLRDMIPDDAIWDRPDGAAGRLGLPILAEEYAYHWAFDYAGLANSVARMYRHADRSPASLERFVDALQWYQAFGLRYCAEAYRRRRFAPIAGCRMWSYREVGPGIKFTVVDHHQRPKMGYFGLQAGYEPVLISIDDRLPLATRAAGSRYGHDVWLINDLAEEQQALEVEAVLQDPWGRIHARWHAEADLPADSGRLVGTLDIRLPDTPGPYLLRLSAQRTDGTHVASNESWVRVIRPAFDRPLRLLLLGQRRYTAPIIAGLELIPGLEIEIVDETNRQPRDSTWSERLVERFDVIWFAGWDNAAYQFRPEEWRNLREGVSAGVGLIHTGGQGSFHGGDGRGALLDMTSLGDALPVALRPRDVLLDVRPRIRPTSDCDPEFESPLEELPFRGHHRVAAREWAKVHWMIGNHPMLVTGRFGAGATVAFTPWLTELLSPISMDEGTDAFWVEASALREGGERQQPMLPEAPWLRADIRAYGPYWDGTLALGLGMIAHAGQRELQAPLGELVDEYRQPLFERLAELPPTTLAIRLGPFEHDQTLGEVRGVIEIRNEGPVLARLVRGVARTEGRAVGRFRDGFVDLLPGEGRTLRFEAPQRLDQRLEVAASAQNSPAAEIVVPTPSRTQQPQRSQSDVAGATAPGPEE
jgi:beta-mannosidase